MIKILLLCFVNSLLAEENNNLKLLHLIFRHGTRTPADTYPTDPYVTFNFDPYGWGQLTNKGKEEQYNQGVWLRNRYDSFIGSRFSPDLIEAWSTGVDRTQMSLQLTMAGLFPPQDDQIWNENLLWQPVPYQSQPLAKDSLLLIRGCPRYAEAFDELLKNNEQVKQKISSYKSLFDYLSEHAGKNISSPDDVQDIHSTLTAEKTFNLVLPQWTSKVYPDETEEATAWSFILNGFTKELRRIKGGPLLEKITSDSKKKEKGEIPNKKLFVYAGHDSTISNLLLSLDVWDKQIPNYNILTIIELREINGIYGVQIYLRNTTLHEPYLLTMPQCESFCSLDKFISLTSHVRNDDVKKSCEAHGVDYKPPKESGP